MKIREFVKEHGNQELDLYKLETATLKEFKEIKNNVMQEVIDTCHVKVSTSTIKVIREQVGNFFFEFSF